jgi:hypothetical protein
MENAMRGRTGRASIDHEGPGNTGNALLIAVFVMFVMTILGLGLLALTDIESRISDNYRNQIRALYLAQSGVERGVYYFNNPSAFTDTSGVYNGYTVGSVADAQMFFEPRMMVGRALSFYNTFGLSQFDDTNNDGSSDGHDETTPVLFYHRDYSSAHRDFLDSIISDVTGSTYIRELMVYAAPAGLNALATIRATAVVDESERTVEVMMAPVPDPAGPGQGFADALASGAGASWNGNAVSVHWGRVRIQTATTDIGNNFAQVPYRTPDAPIDNSSYPGISATDRWLRILTTAEFTGPNPSTNDPSYQSTPSSAGDQSSHQYIQPNVNLFSNEAFTVDYWDYATAKLLAQEYGTYYISDASGNIYLNGEGSPMSFKIATNGRNVGFVFVDTTNGAPPESGGGNLATISVSGDYWTEGLFYLAANFYSTSLGTGSSKTVLSPPILQGLRGSISAGSSIFTVTLGDTSQMVVGDIILIGTTTTYEELEIVSIDGSNSLTVISTIDVFPNAPDTSPALFMHISEDFIIHNTTDVSTRVSVNNFQFNFSGGFYCAGQVAMRDGPRFFGSIIAEKGFASLGVPQIWYDWDLGDAGNFDGFGIPRVTRGAWREIY